MGSSSDIANDTLYCFYDLLHSPITFDFLNFLVVAECYRRYRRFPKLQVVICTGDDATFRRRTEKDHALDQDEKLWRVRHILEPSCRVVPSCQGVWTCLDRSTVRAFHAGLPPAQVFPIDYRPETPKFVFMMNQVVGLHRDGLDVQVLAAPAAARKRVRDWIKTLRIDRPIVALSTRYSPFFPRKNIDPKVWEQFQDHVWERGFQPVLIPDTYLALHGVYPNVSRRTPVFYQGALDYELRAALFDEAFATVSKHGGPALYNLVRRGARCVIFLGDAAHPSADEFARLWDVEWGDQVPWSTGLQRLVYADDGLEQLRRHFDALLDRAAEEP